MVTFNKIGERDSPMSDGKTKVSSETKATQDLSYDVSAASNDSDSDLSSISCSSNKKLPYNSISRRSVYQNRMRRSSETTNISAFSGIDLENNDQLTKLMNFVSKKGSSRVTKVLAARTAIINSIIQLGRHIPKCVLRQLIDEITLSKQGAELENHICQSTPIEIEEHEGKEISNITQATSRRKLDTIARKKDARLGFVHMELPYVEKYQCALLFIDISGFTALSNLLDVERFSDVVNSYFQMIVNTVISHGGDVLKFAGDAIFAEWRAIRPSIHKSNINVKASSTITIEDCTLAAAICGAKVVAQCSDHPVYYANLARGKGQKVASLNVHCGLGVGELKSVHVGNYHSRRELLIIGDPINQVSKAEEVASLGEIVASPEATSLLNKTCVIINSSVKIGLPLMIASKKQKYFTPKKRQRQYSMNISDKTAMSIDKMTPFFEGMHTSALRHLQRKISLYVHSVLVKGENTMTINSFRRQRQGTQTRHRAEAELRSVYTMFIKLLISTEQGKDESANKKLFQLLNNIMNLVTEVLDRFVGHLRQFIVDDKGVVIIATFGLRGSTTPNMIIEKALPATRLLHSILKTELGVDNHIGGTFGKAYCGVVGGILRHEYAVLGKSVNLSARLMCLPNHPGIVVDDAVKIKAGVVDNFRPLDAIKAKGYSHLVPIYVPLIEKEKRWGTLQPYFVGRKREVDIVCNLAKEMIAKEGCPSKMFFMSGGSGSGKSSVVVHTIAVLSKVMLQSRKNFVITRNISNEGDSIVPFSLFRSIFRDVLTELKLEGEEDVLSETDNSSHGAVSLLDKDWDKMSLSASSTGISEYSSSLDRISYLTKELGAPKGFLQIVAHHLMGHSKQSDMEKEKIAVMDEIINFMARAFSRCTCHAELIILAIDDVHYVDRMSWKVVRRIFETCKNVLIFCGSKPLDSYKLSIESGFWKILRGRYKREKRFFTTELGPLEQRDITELISKCLDCKSIEIDGKLSEDIFKQSGGMPYFASEILARVKKEKLCEALENGKIGWQSNCIKTVDSPSSSLFFSSVDELLQHRIDSLSDNVRQILIIAAILGSTFQLAELITVHNQLFSVLDSERDNATNKVCYTIELALKEGILEELFDSEGMDDIENIEGNVDFDDHQQLTLQATSQMSSEYRFYNNAWKQNLMSLVLDSRKSEIHENAAIALEKLYLNEEKHDYRSKLQLHRHWKECGYTSKSSQLALEIGERFFSLGLNSDSIKIYDDALDIYRLQQNDDEEELVCGFSIGFLHSLDAVNLKCLVKLQIAKGNALRSNVQNVKEAFEAYQNGLKILRNVPSSNELNDRSFTFPIFNSLYYLLKQGAVIEPKHEIAYEKELVANFVLETKRHGDPVHYSVALAMEVDFNCRLGKWQKALVFHSDLEAIYNVEDHSTLISEEYITDRAGQSFGASAVCYYQIGDTQKALAVSDYIIANLMPKMDIMNFHNSFMMLYPILWIMKDNGLVAQASSAFSKYVVEAFERYSLEGASTPGSSFFEPIKILLDLCVNVPFTETIERYAVWIQDRKNFLLVPQFMNRIMVRCGRCADSIFAEICLLLSKRIDDEKVRGTLILIGLKFASTALEWCKGDDVSLQLHSAYDQIKPVYEKLLIEYNKPINRCRRY